RPAQVQRRAGLAQGAGARPGAVEGQGAAAAGLERPAAGPGGAVDGECAGAVGGDGALVDDGDVGEAAPGGVVADAAAAAVDVDARPDGQRAAAGVLLQRVENAAALVGEDHAARAGEGRRRVVELEEAVAAGAVAQRDRRVGQRQGAAGDGDGDVVGGR